MNIRRGLFGLWVVFAGFYYRGIKIDPNVVEDVRVTLWEKAGELCFAIRFR